MILPNIIRLRHNLYMACHYSSNQNVVALKTNNSIVATLLGMLCVMCTQPAMIGTIKRPRFKCYMTLGIYIND